MTKIEAFQYILHNAKYCNEWNSVQVINMLFYLDRIDKIANNYKYTKKHLDSMLIKQYKFG